MKNIKNLENRILSSLETQPEKLNPDILDRAKKEIRTRKNRTNTVKYSFAFGFAAIICVALVFLIVAWQKDKTLSDGYTTVGYTSLADYFEDNGIPLKTYGDDLGISGVPGFDFQFKKKDCLLTEYNNEKVCVQETYFTESDIEITLYVFLSDDGEAESDLFPEFKQTDKTFDADGTEISYAFDSGTEQGIASFVYGGYKFYFRMNVPDEEVMVANLYYFVYMQKF